MSAIDEVKINPDEWISNLAEQELNTNEWIPGKLAGGIYFLRGNNYVLKIRTKGCQYEKWFAFSKHGGKEKALIAAESERLKLNKEHNLSKNDYRELDGRTLEVKLTRGYSMLVDADQLENVNKFTWCVYLEKSSSVYALAANSGSPFHRLVLPCPDGFSIDHIHGTLYKPFVLDNRRQNLRVATPTEQSNNTALRKDNHTGVNGVSDLKKCKRYVVRWYQNGVRHCKNFSYGSRSGMTKQGAFEAACAFRKKMDEQTGCTNGVRPCLNLNPSKKRKAEEEQKPEEQLSKRVTTITEYFKQ